MTRSASEDRRRTITIRLESGIIVLFTGDSVTDSGRREDTRGHLGLGYVRAVAESPQATAATIVNTGISGDRIGDLEQK